MESLLKKYGYKQKDMPNEWSKKEWTVRIYDSEMEVFNDAKDGVVGKYYKGEATPENLEIILEDIKNF